MKKILPVVLSGGYGTRLWPLSRKYCPKQFIEGLTSYKGSLFEAALRLVSGEQFLLPLVVSSLSHKFFVLDVFLKSGLGGSGVILEPESKNTALSIFLACIWAKQNYGEDVILLCIPSDHLIEQPALFLESLKNARSLAESGMLTTFGVAPTIPATEYGYIEVGEPLSAGFKAAGFTEKPSPEKAAEFIKSGKFLWNAGIFCFKAGVMLSEAALLAAGNLEAAREALAFASVTGKIITLQAASFERAEDISIDYAIMEKSRKVGVIKMPSKWRDIGNFASFFATLKTDDKGNCGEAMFCNARNNFVFSNKLTVVNGVEDLIIVETRDALLVSSKNNPEELKRVAERLQSQNAKEALFSTKVYRPWGYYEVLQDEPNYKVKRILVRPGGALSLQSHSKRAETWVVVDGEASIAINEDEFILGCGKVAYIPVGAKHKLENRADLPLIIIEIQTGNYFGEDDIVRYTDVYRGI